MGERGHRRGAYKGPGYAICRRCRMPIHPEEGETVKGAVKRHLAEYHRVHGRWRDGVRVK